MELSEMASLCLNEGSVAVGTSPSGDQGEQKPTNLIQFPVELIVNIMRHMPTRDLRNFALARICLLRIFKQNLAFVLVPSLRSLPEFESLLYLYTAKRSDFRDGHMLHPRIIKIKLMLPHPVLWTLLDAKVAFSEGLLVCPEKITLDISELFRICRLASVIDWWVEQYPQMRWAEHPEDRRCLRGHEEVRLRKAIAHWWLYAHYFHNQYGHYSFVPQVWNRDNRLHHLRVLPTSEIRELESLYGLLYETVSQRLCSSLQTNRVYGSTTGEPLDQSVLVPWGISDDRHSKIVSTYLKSDPRQLRYFLQEYSGPHKHGLVKDASSMLHHFAQQSETLSLSILVVLQERMLSKSDAPADFPRMGIIDEDRDDEQACDMWKNDASPTGRPSTNSPGAPGRVILLPRGDDGNDFASAPTQRSRLLYDYGY